MGCPPSALGVSRECLARPSAPDIHRMALALNVGAALALNVVDVGAHSIAKNLPFENKDSYLLAPPRFFGVFDGVSQCPQSRAFSQTLAKTLSVALPASNDDDFGSQAQSALSKAVAAASDYSGASTALVVRLSLDQDEPKVQTCCLGDCQCMILREVEGALAIADISDVKFHGNGAPYQLAGRGWTSDSPADAVCEEFAVCAGDTLLCFSDGFANNWQSPDEVPRAVSACKGMSAEAMAKQLVEQASRAKIVVDDVTVVAMRLGDGPEVRGEAVTSAAEGFDPMVALADFNPLKAVPNPFARK